MNSIARRVVLILVIALLLLALATELVSTAQEQRSLPNPILYLEGTEVSQANGKQLIRYEYGVENFNEYPNEMFAAAPDLPPCGNNNNASRTWVDIYQQDGKRLNGFCALGKPGDLNGIWFALEPDALPPSWVYIELTDRKTGQKYKSNLAETTN